MTGVASMQQDGIQAASTEDKRGRSQTLLLRSLIFALGHFAYPDGSSGAERSFHGTCGGLSLQPGMKLHPCQPQHFLCLPRIQDVLLAKASSSMANSG
jgi:hypothetical protein